ncbi:MAG: hypothetical protein AB1689_28875 [Thermodesulfobacteriota bacterium]
MAREAPPDDFYVGYAPVTPVRVARRVRAAVAALALVALASPLVLLAGQASFAPAAFEFGVTRSYRGTLHARPVPHLLLERPGRPLHGTASVSQVLLVAPGKHGAEPDAAAFDGRAVELDGTLIYRDGRTMLELVQGSIRPLDNVEPLRAPPTRDLGTQRLRGEIVDAKCHLGVMRPGEGKPHRGCAARCLAGGVPAALRAVADDGGASFLVLLGADGRTINHALLDRVAEPVEVTGRVERRGDLLFLYAEPDAVRRLAGLDDEARS